MGHEARVKVAKRQGRTLALRAHGQKVRGPSDLLPRRWWGLVLRHFEAGLREARERERVSERLARQSGVAWVPTRADREYVRLVREWGKG